MYIPQMDYTSRDYTTIRDDLISLISNFAPQWTSRDSSDFGIVLIELFSYLGDLLNYQIDRAANESFIDTATQRETVLRLASLLGYTPNGITAATGTVKITNSSASSVTVPANTPVSTVSDGDTPSIAFTTNNAITVTASNSAFVTVTQGKIAPSTAIGISDGTANQSLPLPDTGVFNDSSLVVSVGNLTYSLVSSLIDYGSDDPVYAVYTNADGITYINFGDGVSGRIPPNGQIISAIYRYTETAASLGNVGSGTVTVIDTAGLSTSLLKVTNTTEITGGADSESTNSIRINAPKQLRSLNRAVSAEDYANLALNVDSVAKAKAIATSFASIALYLAANGGGKTSSTVKGKVSTYFTGKMPPGTTLNIYDAVSVYPYLNAVVAVLPQYNADNVSLSVKEALAALFDFDNVTFNDFISEGDVYSAIRGVEGVSYVTINDYEKLSVNVNQTSGLYSQTGSVSASTTSSTSVIITAGTCGIMTNAIITKVGDSTTHAAVGKTITSVTYNGSANTNTLTLSAACTFAANDVITVAGNAGITAGSRDLTCGINEIPMYNSDYFTITTTGGAS